MNYLNFLRHVILALVLIGSFSKHKPLGCWYFIYLVCVCVGVWTLAACFLLWTYVLVCAVISPQAAASLTYSCRVTPLSDPSLPTSTKLLSEAEPPDWSCCCRVTQARVHAYSCSVWKVIHSARLKINHRLSWCWCRRNKHTHTNTKICKLGNKCEIPSDFPFSQTLIWYKSSTFFYTCWIKNV